MRLAEQGNNAAAVPMLQEASRLEPTNAAYRIDLLKVVTSYTDTLIRRGDKARLEGDVGNAAQLYAQALSIDPGNEHARRALVTLETDVRVVQLLSDAERLARDGQFDAARAKVSAALVESPRNPVALDALARIDRQIEVARDAKAAKAATQSVMKRSVTLQFRDANLRMVFEALSRTTGLNVILDRDVRADLKTTIFVKDAAVEDTVDLILLQNQLEKRSLNANTLFVYPATSAKQKEYQDLQVRTFQVANADVKYLQTVLKSVLKIKDLSFDERSNTLVMRDTSAAIDVAAKVIAAHDLPEPEVMLEMEVLEVTFGRDTNLGIQWPESFSLTTPTGPGGSLTLGALRALTSNELLATPLSATLNLKLHEADSNILASPRVRVRNKEKARILIGDRIPTITNTVTPLGTGAGVVTGTVQYQDVGLKLEVEPLIYPDLDVGIKINFEVSHIVKEIPGPNGSLAYQIGTRNQQTVVRLRDGETQVLGGLISSEDRNAAAKVPGLGQLPILGHLFSNNTGNNAKTEILLSITPHILRLPAVADAAVRDIFSGTESSIRQRPLQLDPVGSVNLQSTGGAPAAPQGRPGAVVRPGAPAPATGGTSSGRGAAWSKPPPAAAAPREPPATAAVDAGQPDPSALPQAMPGAEAPVSPGVATPPGAAASEPKSAQ